MKYLFLLFITLPAWAQFNGMYSGTGSAVYHSGNRYECTEIFLRLETSASFLKIREGGYNCGFLKASFDAFKLTIKDGKLFHQNQQLGSITDQVVEYQVFDPEDGSTYFLNLRNENNEIHYVEKWHDGEKIALTVKGVLKSL